MTCPRAQKTTELNTVALGQTPQDPKVGPTVQITAIQAHVRVRTSPDTEQGLLLNYGGVVPTGGSAVAQANPGSSYNTGAILYTLHTGTLVDPNSEKSQASSGNYFTAGLLFNNPGSDTKVNASASYIHARSFASAGGDTGVDVNAGVVVQPVGRSVRPQRWGVCQPDRGGQRVLPRTRRHAGQRRRVCRRQFRPGWRDRNARPERVTRRFRPHFA